MHSGTAEVRPAGNSLAASARLSWVYDEILHFGVRKTIMQTPLRKLR
jgi:hypothetical protein